MRAAAILCTSAVAIALAVALAVGFHQARQTSDATKPLAPLTRAQVSVPIAGAPAQLAALRRQVNVLHGGGVAAFKAQLRALRGHPVVVNMWGSWCPPCRAEVPVFQREAVKRGAQVAFLGVNSTDQRANALKFAAREPMPYPSFEDPRGNIAAGIYHSLALPVTAFYDAAGRLAIVQQRPFLSEAALSQAIERYALR
jgi:cytochrome c biogenesis protein CcmG, thiol:disulfide interchange protein DsbE